VRRLPIYILLAAAVTACAGNDVIVQRQSSMEGRLEQIMQSQNNSKGEVAGLTLQLKELRDQLARHAAVEQEAQERNQALQNRVNLLAHRLEQVEGTARKPATIELINREEETAGREESVQAEYMKAFGLFSADNYAAAAEAFTKVIADFPESEYAVNARYWLGECYFSTNRYREAIETFSKVIETKPSDRRSADTLLKIGIAWKRLDETEKSSAALKTVIDKYPESEAAIQARQELHLK
jgi:tol-pal system protein YbgF